VLARRGARRVHLIDGAEDVGGYAAFAARLPGLGEWRRAIAWRRRQLDLHRVELTTGLRCDRGLVAAHDARLVVVATGARWRADGTSHLTHAPIPGVYAPHVATPESLPGGARPERAIVYDCEGYFAGVGIAEQLAAAGARVDYLTPHAVVAPLLDTTFEGAWVRARLRSLGVATHVGATIAAIDAGGCTVVRADGERHEASDLIVLLTARVSDDALHLELADDAEGERSALDAVFAIGDCVAPRLLSECVFDGHRLGREIDSPDPGRPLAVRRERALVAAAP
jgi:dimethylamine/trimethylamine dehydrogenase